MIFRCVFTSACWQALIEMFLFISYSLSTWPKKMILECETSILLLSKFCIWCQTTNCQHHGRNITYLCSKQQLWPSEKTNQPLNWIITRGMTNTPPLALCHCNKHRNRSPPRSYGRVTRYGLPMILLSPHADVLHSFWIYSLNLYN